MIYVKTSLSDIKVGCDDGELVAASLKKAGERRGMILNDPEVIAAQSPEYLPVKFKKDGTPMATSEKYLYTPDGWEELMDTVKDIIGEVSHRMRSGQIKPIAKGGKNQKTPCEHCEYKPICRKSAYD